VECVRCRERRFARFRRGQLRVCWWCFPDQRVVRESTTGSPACGRLGEKALEAGRKGFALGYNRSRGEYGQSRLQPCPTECGNTGLNGFPYRYHGTAPDQRINSKSRQTRNNAGQTEHVCFRMEKREKEAANVDKRKKRSVDGQTGKTGWLPRGGEGERDADATLT